MYKVLVTMQSHHWDMFDPQIEPEDYSTISQGVASKVPEGLHIVYECADLEGAKVSKETLLINEHWVKISRPAMGEDLMHFEAGKMTDYTSRTPYGDIYMQVDTKELTVSGDDKRRNVILDYILWAQGEPFTRCRMEITVSEIER